MRDFTDQFPINGFYVVVDQFGTENMAFIPGEVVGIIRWSDSCYVRITKTGERFGGWANYMEVEHMPKLKLLSFEEVSKLTNDAIILAESVQSIPDLAKACKLIVSNAPVTLRQPSNDDDIFNAFSSLRLAVNVASKYPPLPEVTRDTTIGSEISGLIHKRDWSGVLRHRVFLEVIIPMITVINGTPETKQTDRGHINTCLCLLSDRFPEETKGLIEPSMMVLNFQV